MAAGITPGPASRGDRRPEPRRAPDHGKIQVPELSTQVEVKVFSVTAAGVLPGARVSDSDVMIVSLSTSKMKLNLTVKIKFHWQVGGRD